MILEKSRNARLAILVGSHNAAVSDHFPPQEFTVPECKLRPSLAAEHTGSGGDSTKHQPIPSGEDFFVAAGPDSLCARLIQSFFSRCERLIQLIQINDCPRSDYPGLGGNVEDIAFLEISLSGDAEVRLHQ